MSKVTPRDVESLVELFDASDWRELHLELEGFEIHLSKDPGRRLADSMPATTTTAPVSPSAPTAAAHAPRHTGAANPVDPTWVAVRAPNLGTFYRAPKPGAPPFADIGQVVTAETEICLIEVMKLFTALRAGLAGTVRQICAADGELIEYGQVLFYIEPQR